MTGAPLVTLCRSMAGSTLPDGSRLRRLSRLAGSFVHLLLYGF